MYGSNGYDRSHVIAGGIQHDFSQGYFRFKADGSAFEVLTHTTNNTWGLGLSEDGDVFGSTANVDHSFYVGIPNRFYEGVRGWRGNGGIPIMDHKKFHPVTTDVRQVDQFGGYTAAAGHELYTARSFPEAYWNRTAFVCEPTGHLVHTELLVPQGSSFVAKDGYNLLASSDAWTAPIAAMVGPDGAVWVIDFYTPVVQHNPTPHGFKTGAGAAYETPLRDKGHGRIWRIVADNAKPVPYPKLDPANPATMIPALSHENLFWRLQAQRLLVERGQPDVLPKLAEVLENDSIGPAALHALRTMQGLEAFARSGGPWEKLLDLGLAHHSPGVRRAALDCLPRDEKSAAKIVAMKLLSDKEPLVRRDALLALAEMPRLPAAANAVLAMLSETRNHEDRWIPIAAIAAAAASDDAFLVAAAGSKPDASFQTRLVAAVRVVAEHFARGKSSERVEPLLDALAAGNPAVAEAILSGLVAGWPKVGDAPKLSDASITNLGKLLAKLSPGGRSQVIALGECWKIADKFADVAGQVKKSLLAEVGKADLADDARIAAARHLMTVGLDDAAIAAVLEAITPKTSPELARDLLDTIGQSQAAEVGPAIVKHWQALTPAAHSVAISVLLSRPAWTAALLDGLENEQLLTGDLSLDQQEKLLRHADSSLAARAKKILARGGRLPNADRQKVVDDFLPQAQRHGDFAKGKVAFEQNCIKCHRHGEIGAKIGPDLTGIAVRKKVEILIDVLDPNRSVEGNYQQYHLETEDGRTFDGLLASENRTSVELLDSEGKLHVVLRQDISSEPGSFVNTKRSLMPEGFEKLGKDGIADLLEFLTTRGKYLPVPMEKYATAVSTRGLFYDATAEGEKLALADWEPKTFSDVPFRFVDPHGERVKNIIMLNAPQGLARQMPTSVTIDCNTPVKAIHMLGGISGWGYPYTRAHTVSMIVRLHYAGGATEDIPLQNGEHFADYISRNEVPGSKFAFRLLGGQQLRYLAVNPQRKDAIEKIEFVKGPTPPDVTAPIIMAVTLETGE